MAPIATNGRTSFYYLLIAQTCFHRSRSTGDKVRARVLREAAGQYLAKARPAGKREGRSGK